MCLPWVLPYSKKLSLLQSRFSSPRCYFVSVDVTFFESTSFFSSQGENLFSDLISCCEGEHSFPSPTLPMPMSPPVVTSPVSSTPPNPPLQVYHRSQDSRVISYGPVPTASRSEDPVLPPSSLRTDDLPITLRRSTRTCTQHPIAHFLSYNRLSPCLQSFACSLSFISVPSSYKQALSSSSWKQAIDKKMSALHKNHTWELTPLPPGKQTVGCR